MIQGELVTTTTVFDIFAIYDMHKANEGLRAWEYSPQPFKLVCIIDKISRIGQK